MTIKQLHERLNNIIDQNNALDPARNDMDIVIEIRRKTPSGQIRSRYIPLSWACSGALGLAGKNYSSLVAREDDEIKL